MPFCELFVVYRAASTKQKKASPIVQKELTACFFTINLRFSLTQ